MQFGKFQSWRSNSNPLATLAIFFWLVLPNTNSAGPIAFANSFFDCKKSWFAMQIGTAWNVEVFLIRVPGHRDESRASRRIGRVRWTLVPEPGRDNLFRREQREAQRHSRSCRQGPSKNRTPRAVNSLFRSLVQSSAQAIMEPSGRRQNSFIAIQTNDVAGSLKHCGTVPALCEVLFERSPLFLV